MRGNFGELEAIADEVDCLAGFINMLSDVFDNEGNINPEIYRKCVSRAAVSAIYTTKRLRKVLGV